VAKLLRIRTWSPTGPRARPEKARCGEVGADPDVVADQDVVEDRHRPKQLNVLKRPSDPAPDDVMCRGARQAPPVEGDVSGGRRVQARDQVENRGLARTVWPDEADDRPGLYIETHPIEGHHATEPDGDALNREQRHTGYVVWGPARIGSSIGRPSAAWTSS